MNSSSVDQYVRVQCSSFRQDLTDSQRQSKGETWTPIDSLLSINPVNIVKERGGANQMGVAEQLRYFHDPSQCS